jgi:oxygen-dependent protoporphyrinogen oxidase
MFARARGMPGSGSNFAAGVAKARERYTTTLTEQLRKPSPRVAIIGAGIAGLAAAHRLVELDAACRPTLFESAGRLGGVLSTVEGDGFQVEQSADNFITTIPYGLSLCQRLGLTEQLIQTNPQHRQTFVVRRGRLYKLPDGFLMMAPTRMWPLAVTPILSPLGKLRAAMEYFIPPRRDDGDESMAAFVRRRLGREVFDRLVEPLVGAVYAADMERLSVLATLSRFREMEVQHGSLVRAMRKQMKSRPQGKGESGARYSMFVTLRQGLTAIVDEIQRRLPDGTVRLNTRVEGVERTQRGWRVRLAAAGASPADETFDALIVAAPSHEAARLLRPVDAALAADLATIEHSGTAIVSVGYNESQIGHPLDGMGAVVPAIERSPLLAVSFSSRKYTHRAPAGKALLRAFVGGARQPELAEMDDAKLVPLVLGELNKLLRIDGQPCFLDVAHWPGTMPQYHVGHKELVARIHQRVDGHAGLYLAGNAYRGVGLPDCIHGGEVAAERALGG